jgi:hypothetical protein
MATNRAAQAILITKDQPAISNRSAQAVVITQDPPTAQIRNVRGYAMSAMPAKAQIRNVRGYVMSNATKPPPTSVTGAAALLWLLNQNTKGVTFASGQLVIGTPQAYSDPSGRSNTQVLITANQSSGYSGSMTAYYNRRTLLSVFSNTGWLLGTISSATTIRALIPQINTAYGVGLDVTDVVDGPVAAGATSLVLTVASGSYMFKAGDVLQLPSYTLASKTPNTALTGFDDAAGNGPKTATLALFHFDGSIGSLSLVDTSGKNTASTSGTVATSITSKFGTQAVSMASTNAAIVLPDASYLRFTGQDATIEGWFNPANTTQNGVLFGKEASSGSVYGDLQYYQGSMRLWLDSTNFAFSVVSSLVANVYSHVALVSYKGVWYLYENGVLKGQVTGGTLGNNSNPFRIGNYAGLTAPFSGIIDEFRISSFARYTGPFTPPSGPFVLD